MLDYGHGNVILIGRDGGMDTLIGGTGNDMFVLKNMSNAGIIKNFRNGEDVIDLSGLIKSLNHSKVNVHQIFSLAKQGDVARLRQSGRLEWLAGFLDDAIRRSIIIGISETGLLK